MRQSDRAGKTHMTLLEVKQMLPCLHPCCRKKQQQQNQVMS